MIRQSNTALILGPRTWLPVSRTSGIAVDCRWRSDARRYVESDDVLIVAPEIGTHVEALDFSHGKELWRAGYRLSRPLLDRWKKVRAAGALSKKRDRRVSVG